MARVELRTSGRQFRRQFLAAIRGSLIRGLTELITNSDDSYQRLAETQPLESAQPGFGTIVVEYDRKRRRMAVIDWAEGMDAADMQNMIPNYGAATSGLYQDQSVRGYFGKGLKDVLFSMQSGMVESIKGSQLYTARFTWKEAVPAIEISDRPQPATPEIRTRLGIPAGNGTRVSFEIPASLTLPRHDSLLKNLANYYMLRLINASESRRLMLRTWNGKERPEEDRIRYHFPSGESVLDESFRVEYGQSFPVHLRVFRASTPLTQIGDEREGGILIYDEGQAVLDLTLFGFDREEQAARLFGWMQIEDFRQLLKADENVLTDTRDGLERHHPFTQALASEVELRLSPIVEHERHLRLQNTPAQLSGRQRKRLGHSVEEINRLLRGLTNLRMPTGDQPGAALEMPPEGGLEFRPKSVLIHPHRKTPLRLRMDTSRLAPGTPVELQVEGDGIDISPSSFTVPSSPTNLIAVQNMVLSGGSPNQQAQVIAQAGRLRTELQVEVTEEEYPLPENGVAFIPAALHIANNTRRTAQLYISEETAGPGQTISFSVNNPQVEVGTAQITLQAGDFQKGIARVDIPVRGAGIGEKALLVAAVDSKQTSLPIEIVSRRERESSPSRLITGYRFDRSTPSSVRASYDQETGLIWIYLRNPIVERYFGNLPLEVALNTPHCQILLAEIILEQVAWVARQRMIENGSAMYVSENHTEEDLDAVRSFMADYGGKIHSWIADDRRIAQAVENIVNEITLQNEAPAEDQPEEEPALAQEVPLQIQSELAVPVTGPASAPPVRQSLFARLRQALARVVRGAFKSHSQE